MEATQTITQSKATCIFKVNTYAMGQRSKSELFTETPDGNRAPLLPVEKGQRTKLTITDAGYTIENSTGAIVARGLETEVFAIVKQAHGRGITLEPLQIEINTAAEVDEMSFDEYRELYGGADNMRDNRRKFKAYQVKGENHTAIGITEYSGGVTRSIASLYFDKKLNNRQAFETVGAYISDRLNSSDYGIVILTDFRINRFNHERYQGVIRFHSKKYTPGMDEVRKLAEDAEERRSSITEVFDGQESGGDKK